MRFLASIALIAVAVLADAICAAAQDRIILFEPYVQRLYEQPRLPGELREVEITTGGVAGQKWCACRSRPTRFLDDPLR